MYVVSLLFGDSWFYSANVTANALTAAGMSWKKSKMSYQLYSQKDMQSNHSKSFMSSPKIINLECAVSQNHRCMRCLKCDVYNIYVCVCATAAFKSKFGL